MSNSTVLKALLTAGHLLEMSDLLVSPHGLASSEVGVHVTLVEPGVEISRETGWSELTGFLAGLEILELSENSSTTGNVESLVHRDDLN